MHHPTRFLILGFATVILMMITLAFIGFQAIQDSRSGANYQVATQLEKINLVNELSTIIQNRTRFMQSMLLHDKETALQQQCVITLILFKVLMLK